MTICTFRIGQSWFGIDTTFIQEIIPAHRLTDVPWSPKNVSGLFSFRGKLVACLDFLKLLGEPSDRSAPYDWQLVLQHSSDPLAWGIDEPGDIYNVSPSDLEGPPAHVPSELRSVLPQALKVRQSLVLLVDLDALVQRGRAYAA